ncbi:MAG: hypothetical protein JSS86_26080 [Cyanobacteria bacterium SZAS LIN-2]|nr:hypothetical protein [Cyanobacteria bacterium SZAS LIN-2]
MKPWPVSSTGLLISALLPLILLCGCAASPSKPQAAAVESTKSGTIKKPRKMFPYRMGGDWAGGGAETEEIDRGTRKKIEVAMARQQAVLGLYDQTGLTSKVVREDLELLRKPEASCIRDLDIGDNDLSDEDIEPLSQLSLEVLRARENELHDLHALANMKSLRSLDLADCAINQQGLAVLQGLPRLTYLCLDLTNFQGMDLSGLCRLKNLKNLKLIQCTGISKETLDKLKAALPSCNIEYNPGLDPMHVALLDLRHIEMSLMADGDYAHADLSISGLMDKWKSQSQPQYRAMAQGYHLRGICQEKLMKLPRAAEMYSSARDIYVARLSDYDELPENCVALALVLERLNRPGEARAERVRADKFWRRHAPIARMERIYKANCKWLSAHPQ